MIYVIAFQIGKPGTVSCALFPCVLHVD